MTRTRLAPAAALTLLLCLVLAAPALGANRGIVGTNGQIGQLRLDVSTEDDIRAVEGEPDDVSDFRADNDPNLRIRAIFYSCGRLCGTVYYLNVNEGGVLANFATSNRAFRTRKGTRPGYSRKRAQRIEGRRFRSACGPDTIGYGGRGGRPYLQIAADGRRVTFIALHSAVNNVLDC